MLAEEAHLRSAHAGVGAALDGRQQSFDPLRMGSGIVVQGGDIGRLGGLESLIDGGAEPVIAMVLDDAHTRGNAVTAHQSLTAVVNDDHLKIPPCLAVEGLETLQQPRIRGQGGNHYRYQDVRQTPILTWRRRGEGHAVFYRGVRPHGSFVRTRLTYRTCDTMVLEDAMPITASKLREDVYRILDEAIETGKPVEIIRKGVTLTIMPPKRVSKMANLKKRKIFVGDVEDIIGLDWSKEWTELQ
jgi:hypothetical protein